jgi:hypothetical protein
MRGGGKGLKLRQKQGQKQRQSTGTGAVVTLDQAAVIDGIRVDRALEILNEVRAMTWRLLT